MATPIDHMARAHLKINRQPQIPIMWKQQRYEFNTSGYLTLTSVQPSYMINFCQYSHERQLITHLHGQSMGLIFSSPILHCITLDLVILRPIWITYNINSLHAKFCRGNINIHLHFMSLLHIDMTQVLKILPQVRPEPTYSTWSISWLLMSWWRKEPGHQQQWYWPS